MRGTAIIAAFILIVIGSLIVGGYLLYVSHESNMTKRLNDSIKALYIAEAGLERALEETYSNWHGDSDEDGEPDHIFRLNGIDFVNFGSDAPTDGYVVEESWITVNIKKLIKSTGTYGNVARFVNREVYLDPDVNLYDKIVAACGGSGGQISGNVKIMGSLYITGEEPFVDANENDIYDAGESFLDFNGNDSWGPYLGATDYAFQMTGSSEVGNNYLTMPVTLKDRVPSIYDDELEKDTLNATLMAKYGMIELSGTASVGAPEVEDIPESKNPMDLVNVPDGFDVGEGELGDYVYTDELLYDRGRFSDQVRIPSIKDAYTDKATDTFYASPEDPYTSDTVGGYEAYLLDKGLDLSTTYGITDLIITPTSSFTYGDVTTPGANGIAMDGAGNLKIKGLVYINGSLTIDKSGGQNTILYTGRGSLYVRGYRDSDTTNDVIIGANVYSDGQFPSNIIGVMTRENIYFTGGAGTGDKVMGLFYAEKTIKCTKQYNVAGTFISTYFDMGTNVPRIYQVPAAAEPVNQPPYMITATYPGLGPVFGDWYETYGE